jgi:hypothetical protein
MSPECDLLQISRLYLASTNKRYLSGVVVEEFLRLHDDHLIVLHIPTRRDSNQVPMTIIPDWLKRLWSYVISILNFEFGAD